MAVGNEDGLQVRVEAQGKQLLERAAERSVISLSPDAAQAFSDELARPAAVNERLAVALDRPRGFRWVG